MKKRVLTLLILTTIWGLGSWWYYTCKIKGFCNTTPNTLNSGTTKNTTTSSAEPNTGSKQVIDSDGDGLTDDEELTLATDPNNIDSDGDSIPDNEEVGSEPGDALDSDQDGKIDALDKDDDNDTLPTLLEIKLNTNPLEKDSDDDGIDDAKEVGSDTNNPINTDGDKLIDAIDPDDDNDGIATRDEIAIGINPLKADTDGDGLNDAEEIGEIISKPKDSDEDGIIDALDNNNSPTAKVVASEDSQAVTEVTKTEDTPATNHEQKTETESKDETGKAAADEISIETIKGNSTATAGIEGSLLYFPFNSAEPKLSKFASNYFEKITQWLQESSHNKVVLTGHTDSIGSKSANHKLGLKRAIIIKKMLIKLGAPKQQISATSKGETKPIKTNKTKIGRKKNRRVELTLIGNK